MDIKDLTFHDATLKPLEERGFDMPSYEPQKMIIDINDDQLPEIKDWETGKDYTIVLKVTQIGNRLQGNGDKMAASFDISEIAGYYEDTKSK